MDLKILSQESSFKVRGSDHIKYKYVVEHSSGLKRCVLQWQDNPCIVYDYEQDEQLSKYNWYINQCGYVGCTSHYRTILLHDMVMNLNGVTVNHPSESVDHIDQIKCHNVSANLRVAVMSEQNVNRQARSDKLPPPQELVDAGITFLPRYVRYDKSEHKFIIEKVHPGCAKDKKFNLSGTKSTNVSMIYKYYTILKKLHHLYSLVHTDDTDSMLAKKRSLCEEYSAISQLITGSTVSIRYEDVKDYDLQAIESLLTPAEKEYDRRGLPADSNIDVTMLPQYCCYTKATDKRGDSFYVSRHHPNLQAYKKDVKTTSSKNVSLEQKYASLIELLEAVNSGCISLKTV